MQNYNFSNSNHSSAQQQNKLNRFNREMTANSSQKLWV